MKMNNELMLVNANINTTVLAEQMNKATEFEAKSWGEEERRYYAVGELAVIPVHGYLAHRMDYHVSGWVTGYAFIQNAIQQALDTPSVKGIVLDVNSGGGMVSGAFELADFIRDAATKKPMVSIVDSSAYSAAYLLASQTNKVYVSKSGGVGSIGVVTMHVDVTKMLEKEGYKVTMLYKGDQKVDGNPYEELSDEARQRIMNKLELSYNLFVDAVAAGRKIDVEAVRNTEAGTFLGEQALSVGLVDTVMNPTDAYAVFAQELSKVTGGLTMTTQAQTPVEMDSTVVKQEERQRIQGILGSQEAEGRSELANHLAYETEMSVEAALAMLSKAPQAQTQQSFDGLMAGGNPEIGDEVSAPVEADSPVNSIMASLQAATGLKLQ